ncbi:MAG: DUF2892 domain-containing protein [Deltaproteobacteria bacterium]|jgi:hypothetical protein|nr:DUF2892 domain-containing protein [Deltaproteobacteria bacterium]
MKKNVGPVDRLLRLIVGLIIIGIGYYYQSWWGAIGVLMLLTAAMGWCPPYSIFKISTCKREET